MNSLMSGETRLCVESLATGGTSKRRLAGVREKMTSEIAFEFEYHPTAGKETSMLGRPVISLMDI